MILRFVAEHQIVVADQVAELTGLASSTAVRRLGRLATAGYLASDQPFRREPAFFWATRRGTAAAGRPYRAGALNILSREHDVGLGWLWLAAHRGVFGELHSVVSERAMRSADQRSDGEPFGVRLAGSGTAGTRALHHPDLLLVTPAGQQIAVELELTQKPAAKLDAIIGRYAGDARIDAVLYLVEDRGRGPAIGRAVDAAAARWGMAERVHVQRFTRTAPTPAMGRERAREHARGSRADQTADVAHRTAGAARRTVPDRGREL